MDSEPSRISFPGAPPDKVRGAIETLFLEWQSVQAERMQWKSERAQLRSRIIQLENEARSHEKVRLDLIRRIKLLEHGLLSERMNYVAGGAPSRFALGAGGAAGAKALNGIRDNAHRLPSAPNGQNAAPKSRFYRTLPSDFLTGGEGAAGKGAGPGRQFLREYLIELGYLKEAEQLDPHFRPAAGSGPPGGMASDAKFEDPVKQPAANALGDDGDSPDKPKGGSFAKPNAKPTSVTQRRNSADRLLMDQGKSSDTKRWKPTVPLRSHMDSVRCVSWHSTEPVILTGSEDGTAKLWNLSDEVSLTPSKKKKATLLEPGYTFRGHRGMITSAVLADQLGRVFTTGVDGQIISWDMPPLTIDAYDDCGRCLKFKRNSIQAHQDAVWGLTVHPAPSTPILFSSGADGTVGAWKVDGDAPTALYHFSHPDGKSNVPTTVGVVPSDLKKIIVGFSSGDVALTDIETGKAVRVMKSSADSGSVGANAGNLHINDVCLHPTIALAVTAHVDNNVRIFDINQGACVSVMQTHRDAVTSVSIDPSGLYLASASHDQSLRFWDFTSKKILQDLDGYQTHRSKFDEAIHMVRYHPCMPLVATGGADSVAKVYQ